MKKPSVSRIVSLVCCLVFGTVLPLSAQEKTWIGSSDGSWANGGNWSPSALVSEMDSVLYDESSAGNLVQTLDQSWSVTGIRVTSAPGPVTILPGFAGAVLTNTGTIDLSAASADLSILADYAPVNNGTLTVGAGRTLTLSNILNNIISTPAAMAGSGTIRILGSARRLNDQINSVTLIVDGGSVSGNPPVRLSADTDATVTVVLTNNGSFNIAPGNGARVRLGNIAQPQSTNHLIIDGGTVTIAGSTSSGASGFYVGDASGTVGVLDINNGTIDMSDRSSGNAYSVMRMGVSADAKGIVNLNPGGRLLTPRIDRIDGYGAFNFNGGYLRTTISGDYFEMVDEVNVLAGGAVIDTTGSAILAVVASPLAGPGGLIKLGPGQLNLPASSYAGSTTVSNGTLGLTLPLSSSALTLSSNASLNVTVGSSADSSWSPASITLEGANAITFNYAPESQPSSSLIVAPSLSAFGTNFINITGGGWPIGTIRLIDYDGTINGGGTFAFGALPIGLNARLTNNPTTSSIDLVVSSGVNNLDWYGYMAFGGNGGGLWDISTTANWNGGGSVYNEYGIGLNQVGDAVRFTPAGYNLVDVATTVRPSAVTISNVNSVQFTFTGPGKINGPTSLVKEGTGANSTVLLSLTNDYTGGTFIRVGNISLGTDNALPMSGLVYVGSPGSGASLTMNGFNQTVGGIIAAGSGSGNRRVLNGSATHVTLTIDVAADQTNVYSHTMGNTGVAGTDPANNFSVVKMGDGIQTFGNSAYSGTTTIKGGTLLFNGGASTLTGTVTVESGGTLGGQTPGGGNSIGAPVVVLNGGRIEPGNLGIGTLTVTNSVNLGGELLIQVNRTNSVTSDRLVAVSIALGGTLIVTNAGDALQAGDSFTLLAGGLSGSFANMVLPPLGSGLSWDTANLAVNGTLMVVSAAQPNFSAFMLVGDDLVISGTGGPANGTYHILTSTDVALPVASWTPVMTNSFDAAGNFSFTNSVASGSPQSFFMLSIP